MGGKIKGRVYGKNPKPRDTDLAEAFNTLSLSDDNRSPLADRSVNAPKTVPLSPKVIGLDCKSTKTLVAPTPRRTPLQDTPPKVTTIRQYEASPEIATANPQRKLRSITRALLKRVHHQITDETTYLSPLTAISDVEAVVQHFDLWAQTMDKLLDIEMIGDGSYANVFKLSSKTDPLDYSITKLIPLRPRRGPGSRSLDLTTVENAASEIQVLAKLSGVTGFTDFKRAMLLRGQLPKSFRDACKTFDKKRKEKAASRQESERKCRTNYPKPQVWLFVEMGDAGEELEQILLRGFDSRLDDASKQDDTASQKPFLTLQQTRDIFYSTVEALALGEHEALFEHRDLHLSNVCLKRLETDIDIRDANLDWQLVPSSNTFAVTLIDYTLSRADTEEGTVFNPMNDEVCPFGHNFLPRSLQSSRKTHQKYCVWIDWQHKRLTKHWVADFEPL